MRREGSLVVLDRVHAPSFPNTVRDLAVGEANGCCAAVCAVSEAELVMPLPSGALDPCWRRG